MTSISRCEIYVFNKRLNETMFFKDVILVIFLLTFLQGRLVSTETKNHCHRGFVPLKNICKQVSWSKWSVWSKCIKTEWGGLQTRTRKCKRKSVVHNGYCIGRGSESRRCSLVTSEYRIRKNIRDLTDIEVHDLLQAMSKFKRDLSRQGYFDIVRYHGWPHVCPWMKWMVGHENGHCSYHGGPLFLPWHRIYIVQFELGLQRYLINKTLGFPYWDWLEPDWYDMPDLIGKRRVFDPVLKKLVTNPFFRSQIVGHKKYKGKILYTQRAVDKKGMHYWKKYLASVLRAFQQITYMEFDDTLEANSHSQIHACACKYKYGRCVFGMPTIPFTSWDPLFMFHHSQVDRFYALRKKLHDVIGNEDWTAGTIMDKYQEEMFSISEYSTFDRPLCPFKNSTINPFEVTSRHGSYTMRNGYYYEQIFGYKYDSLNLGGRSWYPIVKDMKRKLKEKSWRTVNEPFLSSVFPEFGVIRKGNSNFTSDYCNTFPPVRYALLPLL